MNLINLYLTFFLILSSLNANASLCSNVNIVDLGAFQGLINVVESTDEEVSSAKKITNSETIIVDGLTSDKFNKIAKNPESIAYILEQS